MGPKIKRDIQIDDELNSGRFLAWNQSNDYILCADSSRAFWVNFRKTYSFRAYRWFQLLNRFWKINAIEYGTFLSQSLIELQIQIRFSSLLWVGLANESVLFTHQISDSNALLNCQSWIGQLLFD